MTSAIEVATEVESDVAERASAAAWLRERFAVVVERALSVDEPGRESIARAVVALANARGAWQTQERALDVAAAAIAWAAVFPPEDPPQPQAWRERHYERGRR